MAQLTGTTILAEARVFAQDTSTSAPAVSDANGLILLNDVLQRWTGDVEAKQSLISATDSGLTFGASVGIVETTAQDLWDTILSAHESDGAAVPAILSPQLEHWTVERMLDTYRNDYDGTVTGGGSKGWLAYAWERVAASTAITGSTAIRVYVYPVLAATRYLIVRVPKTVELAALTDTPDLSRREAGIVKRLLAWEMARLHTRDGEFLQQILAPIPSGVLDRYFESAKTHGWMQGSIRQTGALDG